MSFRVFGSGQMSSSSLFHSPCCLPRLRSDASSAIAIGSRTTIMVLDSKVGFGEIQDRAGTYILAKATA